MGTRGAIGYYKDGQIKATYNHFDSYPDALGQEMLKFARSKTPAQHAEAADRLQMIDTNRKPTPEDVERWKPYTDLGVSRQSTDDWYCLMREAQGKMGVYVEMGQMPDGGADFMRDSLFCEYAYLVNCDEGTFEIYKGFQHEPPKRGVFAGDEKFEAAGLNKETKYYPVELMKAFLLNDLPEQLDAASLPEHFCREDEE